MFSYKVRIFAFIFIFISCSKELPVDAIVTKPGVPTNIQATAGDASATIKFSEPLNNGGAPIINYIVTSTPGNIITIGLKSPIFVTGLSNGVSYTFTVIAVTSSGQGKPSVESNAIVPEKMATPQKNCQTISICNYDLNSKSDFAMTVYYDSINRPSKLLLYDSIRNVMIEESVFKYQADVLYISKYEQFVIDSSTGLVKKYSTKENLNNINSDDLIFEYIYNDSGYLITKNQFINGSTQPTYRTSYIYDASDNLISCLMFIVSGNKKVLESNSVFEESIKTKDFIYTFADGFENYIYTPILNYGKRPKCPIKNIVTKLYDPLSGSLLDTWTTSFGSFSLNLDGYLTQMTQTGDFQQGLGMFFGKTVFGYQCR